MSIEEEKDESENDENQSLNIEDGLNQSQIKDDKMELETKTENEGNLKGKITVNLNKSQKGYSSFLSILNGNKSSKAQDPHPDDGKESLKRKTTSNQIGENVLKKLKLI